MLAATPYPAELNSRSAQPSQQAWPATVHEESAVRIQSGGRRGDACRRSRAGSACVWQEHEIHVRACLAVTEDMRCESGRLKANTWQRSRLTPSASRKSTTGMLSGAWLQAAWMRSGSTDIKNEARTAVRLGLIHRYRALIRLVHIDRLHVPRACMHAVHVSSTTIGRCAATPGKTIASPSQAHTPRCPRAAPSRSSTLLRPTAGVIRLVRGSERPPFPNRASQSPGSGAATRARQASAPGQARCRRPRDPHQTSRSYSRDAICFPSARL
jgi:hypothetical protein